VTPRPENDRVSTADRAFGILAALGRGSLARARIVLTVGALALGVFRELARAASWRRPVRAEFARALRQSVGGGLLTTVVAAALIGIAMVYQALFWLSEAGQERLIGSILVTVLVREVAPLIVGLILLGRSGIVTAAEISALQSGEQFVRLEAQGIDPFLLLVLPRATAFALVCYTLGIVFVLATMAISYVAGNVGGGVRMSLWELLATVLGEMRPADFAVFPVKMLTIGLLGALTAIVTGLGAGTGDVAANLLPRTFVRGTLAVMLTSVTLSLAI
jgi:phospholipid/cholesterol/gamma-HCH transport system permease protein